jgi:N-acetylglutamate synthase-like GNAT family acetyltransferase
MDIRPYVPSDRDECLSVFDSNVPREFASDDRVAFARFLEHAPAAYFVMEHEGAILGCGGFEGTEPGVAQLVWGMIRAKLQGQGLGRFLLMYQLKEIGKLGRIERVRVEVSPQTAPFFASQGFKMIATGDKVELVKRLSVCG